MNRKKVLKLAVGLIAVGCFLYIGKNYFGQLDKIAHAHWVGIVAAAIVHLITLWLQGLTIKWGLDSYGRGINHGESFTLFVLSSYANLILPRSGVGTTAIYLNRVHKSSMIDYSSVVLFNGALFVLACSAVGCSLMGFEWLLYSGTQSGETHSAWMVASIIGIFVVSLLAVAVPWRMPSWYRGPGAALLNRLNKATLTLAKSSNLKRIGLAHLGLVFLRTLRLYLAFWAMGIHPPFLVVLFTSVLADLAFAIAFTPSGIGFREAAISVMAIKLGTTVPMALSAAVLDRLVFSLVVVIVAQVIIALVIRKDQPDSKTKMVTGSPHATTQAPSHTA